MLRIQDAILYGSKRGSGSGPTPSGSIEISENGTYDVTDKAEAVVDVEPDLTTKQITQNGTYSASSDNVDGYSAVTVAVPQPSGTKQVTISQNGTTTEDVEDYENAQITVNVQPNLTTKQITQNGTYPASGDNADGYSSVTVNVSGGADYTMEDALIQRDTFYNNYVNSRVTRIGDYAFCNLNIFNNYSFPNVTQIGASSFDGNGMNSIDLPSVTTIGNDCIKSCTHLMTINIPNLTTAGDAALSNNSNITSLNLPLLTQIGYSGFASCRQLQSVNLPLLQAVPTFGFSTDDSLKSIVLPLATSIGRQGFAGCSRLTTADFPLVTAIFDTYNFNNCSKLTSLILRNTTKVATLGNTNAFNSTPIASGTGYIYVPAALKSQYEAATNWSRFAAQFRALEDYTVDGTTTGALDPTKI